MLFLKWLIQFFLQHNIYLSILSTTVSSISLSSFSFSTLITFTTPFFLYLSLSFVNSSIASSPNSPKVSQATRTEGHQPGPLIISRFREMVKTIFNNRYPSFSLYHYLSPPPPSLSLILCLSLSNSLFLSNISLSLSFSFSIYFVLHTAIFLIHIFPLMALALYSMLWRKK